MKPTILVIEDDATSAAFLAAAAEALPAVVDVAGSLATARVAAGQHDYRLWLIDANLPDGSGIELLRLLRTDGHRAAAIAHTAAHERSALDGLIDAGFDDVLVKPLTAAQLHAAIRQALGQAGGAAPSSEDGRDAAPVWDDAIAAAALKGSFANVQILRKLCLGELPQARDDIGDAFRRGDRHELHRVLHKLRASCGFVGARRLDQAVRALQDAPGSQAALDLFNAALQDTLSSD